MQRDEIRDAGRVAGRTLGDGITLVRDAHLGLAGRAFRLAGPAGRPVQLVHDGVSRAVYGSLTGVNRWAPRLGAGAAAVTASRDREPMSATKRGNLALGALNGLWGDRLVGTGNALGIGMSVRHDHADVALTAEGMARAYPSATGRIAVFVHGLCETEDAWFPSERKQAKDGSLAFGPRLADDVGYTPVYVRFNSGLHVSDNGAALSAILESLTGAWPVAVDEIVLVGHSMGGLVLRSACFQGDEQRGAWVDRVYHVFCLGTPHLGSPLERGANAVAFALNKLPETQAIAGVLNRRSAGIKDLRYGALIEADWHGADPDEYLTDRCNEVPFLPHASYYFVGVTVTRHVRHPLGVLAGDLFVQFTSASGKGRRREIPFDIDKGHHVGGLHHFDLLSHPDVYAQLERWLVPVSVDA